MSGDSVETSESLDSNNRLRGVPFGAPLEECRYVEARALVDTGALYMFVPENVLKVDNGSLTFSRRVAENRPPESLIRATMGGTLPYPLVELVVSMRVGEKAVAGTVTAVIAPADLGELAIHRQLQEGGTIMGEGAGHGLRGGGSGVV